MTIEVDIRTRLLSPDFERWAHGAQAAGHCSHPVRLKGSAYRVDQKTGRVLREYSSASEPDGVTYVRCGNRRAVRCPSCSDEYKSDMWHLIAAGVSGASKGVPESVSRHPLVFATLTAPSFGTVHSARERNGRRQSCRPRDGRETCPHGKAVGCSARHSSSDAEPGEPICPECYDYEAHVLWQWQAPELWRRFTIRLRRELASWLGVSETRARELVRVQYAKVAEFQRRGAVHFHALIRLDGPATEDEPFPAPAVDVPPEVLADLTRAAARAVSCSTNRVRGEGRFLKIRWGRQCDVRVVRRRAVADDDALTDRAVAAYIAKYATKATEDLASGENGRKRPHIARLRKECITLARMARAQGRVEFERLDKWDHMLGFRGHFSTKSRHYSTTLGKLREARREWQKHRARSSTQAAGQVHQEETVLVIGSWVFAGMGWKTPGDAHLVAQAAEVGLDLRRRRRTKHDETRRD